MKELSEMIGTLEDVRGLWGHVQDLKIVVNDGSRSHEFYKRYWTPKDRKQEEYKLESLRKKIRKKVRVQFENVERLTKGHYIDVIGYLIMKLFRKNKGIKSVPRIYKEIKSIKYLE